MTDDFGRLHVQLETFRRSLQQIPELGPLGSGFSKCAPQMLSGVPIVEDIGQPDAGLFWRWAKAAAASEDHRAVAIAFLDQLEPDIAARNVADLYNSPRIGDLFLGMLTIINAFIRESSGEADAEVARCYRAALNVSESQARLIHNVALAWLEDSVFPTRNVTTRVPVASSEFRGEIIRLSAQRFVTPNRPTLGSDENGSEQEEVIAVPDVVRLGIVDLDADFMESVEIATQVAEKTTRRPGLLAWWVKSGADRLPIQGQSAGAAFAAVLAAALANKKLRSDRMVTASLDAEGELQPVSHLEQKREAARGAGARYLYVAGSQAIEHDDQSKPLVVAVESFPGLWHKMVLSLWPTVVGSFAALTLIGLFGWLVSTLPTARALTDDEAVTINDVLREARELLFEQIKPPANRDKPAESHRLPQYVIDRLRQAQATLQQTEKDDQSSRWIREIDLLLAASKEKTDASKLELIQNYYEQLFSTLQQKLAESRQLSEEVTANAPCYVALGHIEYNAGDFAAAAKMYHRYNLLVQNSYNGMMLEASANLSLAHQIRSRGNRPQADKQFQRALELWQRAAQLRPPRESLKLTDTNQDNAPDGWFPHVREGKLQTSVDNGELTLNSDKASYALLRMARLPEENLVLRLQWKVSELPDSPNWQSFQQSGDEEQPGEKPEKRRQEYLTNQPIQVLLGFPMSARPFVLQYSWDPAAPVDSYWLDQEIVKLNPLAYQPQKIDVPTFVIQSGATDLKQWQDVVVDFSTSIRRVYGDEVAIPTNYPISFLFGLQINSNYQNTRGTSKVKATAKVRKIEFLNKTELRQSMTDTERQQLSEKGYLVRGLRLP